MSDNLFSRLRKRFNPSIDSATDGPAPPFKTERLQLWRSRDLNPNFSETLNKIEKFGWQTWSVFAKETADNFAYTVGVFDTLGLPELITIGLPVETGAQSLNRAVALMRKGVDLSKGRF